MLSGALRTLASTRCATMVIVWLLLAGQQRTVAAQSQLVGPQQFSQATIDAARTLANVPADTTVVQSTETNGTRIAQIERHDDGNGNITWVITLYIPTIRQTFGIRPNGNPLNGDRSAGLLCGTFMHELMHKCDGETQQKDYSCSHIAIRTGSN